MEKQSIIKALERARDEIANALNLVQHGVINPAATGLSGEETFGETFGEATALPAEPKAKRGRPAKAAPAVDSDPFADAMGEAAPTVGGDDGSDFFSEQPAVVTGPTEKDVNNALVAAVTRLVAAGNAKTDARDKVLGAMEKKFGSKDPAKLKTKWAEVIAFFTPKK